jgi:hypothetical protein
MSAAAGGESRGKRWSTTPRCGHVTRNIRALASNRPDESAAIERRWSQQEDDDHRHTSERHGKADGDDGASEHVASIGRTEPASVFLDRRPAAGARRPRPRRSAASANEISEDQAVVAHEPGPYRTLVPERHVARSAPRLGAESHSIWVQPAGCAQVDSSRPDVSTRRAEPCDRVVAERQRDQWPCPRVRRCATLSLQRELVRDAAGGRRRLGPSSFWSSCHTTPLGAGTFRGPRPRVAAPRSGGFQSR